MNKIVSLASKKTSVEQTLTEVAELEFRDILILGYAANGSLDIRSSGMSRANAVFIMEQAKKFLLGTDDEDED